MRSALFLLVLTSFALPQARAQCKDCGCKAKCAPTCQCQHGGKTKAP